MRSRLTAFACVVTVILAATAGTPRADERVDVTAMDGVQLIAELAGTRGPGLVLVHDVGEDRSSWGAISDALSDRGFRVLRLDLRGFGESGGARDVGLADRDVEGAYRYLLGRKIRPVFLVAKGTSTSAALRVASRVPTAGVVLVGGLGAASDAPAGTAPVLRIDDLSTDAARTRLATWLSATSDAAR